MNRFGACLLAAAFSVRPAISVEPGPRPAPVAIAIDYPLEGAVFPPELPPPTFLWRGGPSAEWRIEVGFSDGQPSIQARSKGERMRIGEIDRRCIAPTNKLPKLTPEQAAAHTWVPDAPTWAAIKKRSAQGPATLTISAAAPGQKAGKVTFTTSKDPVGAPIFYRDVPLMPSETEKGVIKPISQKGVPLIAWRLRNVGETGSKLLLTDMHTCANCHSFSSDGKTLGMDLDGPANDKGLYAVASVRPRMSIRNEDIIPWKSLQERERSPDRIGFMSQVSPDGRYVLTRLSGAGTKLQNYYVTNFKDYRFLQVFYPTRGILAYYDRTAGRAQPLPGGDDPRYVHTDGVWSPDGKYIIFARAAAKDPYPAGWKPAAAANDPNELQIQYDLYRIPFNGGRGGKAEPIPGASQNGMSNNFPKVSPDGRWIVFVQCRNGQLMRPDSVLYMVPFEGGKARRMRCNTPLMNSWHSFSPNGRWMVFSSKSRSPYTQMYLTHLDADGNDSPAVLIENATAANRAVNIPEFVNIPQDGLESIEVPAAEFYKQFDLAADLSNKEQYAAAVPEWRKAIELNPDDARTFINLGSALAATGKPDEAVRSFRRALEIDPANGNIYSHIGVTRARQGQFEEAIPNLRKALELNPEDEIAARNLCGALALSETRTDEAIAYCRKTIQDAPSDAAGYVNLAIVLSRLGKQDEAIAQLQKAAALAPKDATVQSNLGTALVRKGRIAEAIVRFENALRLAPDYMEGHYYLAVLYSMRGRTPEALLHARKLLAANPNHVPTLVQTAQLLASSPDAASRNGAEAVTLAERAVKLSGGTNPDSLDALAAAYAEAGRYPQAVETARRAVELAERSNNPQFVQTAKARLALYEKGQPFRLPPPR